jgi:hypothetical protein
MAMRRLYGYVTDTVVKYGVGALLLDVLSRLINKVVEFQILECVAIRLQDVSDPFFLDDGGMDARFADEEELLRFARTGKHDLTTSFVSEAMRRGDRCYAIFDGGELAAYGWYSNLPTQVDDHFTLHFDPRWTYMYKGYTAPGYRGRRLHAVGMCRALREVTAEGKAGLVSWIASNNFSSLHSCLRLGYRVFGKAWLLRAGGYGLTRTSAGCRPYGFEVEALAAGAGSSAKKAF